MPCANFQLSQPDHHFGCHPRILHHPHRDRRLHCFQKVCQHDLWGELFSDQENLRKCSLHLSIVTHTQSTPSLGSPSSVLVLHWSSMILAHAFLILHDKPDCLHASMDAMSHLFRPCSPATESCRPRRACAKNCTTATLRPPRERRLVTNPASKSGPFFGPPRVYNSLQRHQNQVHFLVSFLGAHFCPECRMCTPCEGFFV